MKTYKSIQYAFPTSQAASLLGFYDKGCWHITLTHVDIEGSGQCRTFIPHNAEGFSEPDAPDLIDLFLEHEELIDYSFLKHGNTKALNAIAGRI